MWLKRISLGIQILMTIGLPILLLRDFNWDELQSTITQIPFWFFIVGFVIFTIGQMFYPSRWFFIIQAMNEPVRYFALVEQHYIGIYFNNFLPAMIGGDSAKIYYLGKQQGYLSTTTSVFLDRFLGFLALTLIALITGLSYPATSEIEWLRLVLLMIAILFGTIILGLIFFPLNRIIFFILSLLPLSNDRSIWLESRLTWFFDTLRILVKKPWLMLTAISIVLLYFILLSPIYLGFFYYALGVQVSVIQLLGAISTIAILSNIPITLNGIGLREQLHFLMFTPLAIQKEVAVSASLLIFIYLLLSSLIGYVIWYTVKSRKTALDTAQQQPS